MPRATARVVCRQLAPVLGDLEGNRRLSTAAVRDAVAGGADIVVLPELVTSGYVFTDRAEAAAVAITPEHPVFADWAAAAGRAVVVGGFCERGPGGALHNSAAVVDSGGVRAVYRKTHLWDREKLVFDQGDEPPPVLDTAAGRLGVLICYDLEFPELTRDLAMRGADLLVAPVNWPLVERPPGEHPPEVLIAMAAARVNRVAIACCDRAGPERGQRWTEGTTIIDSSGWIAARPGPDGTAVAELDLAASRDKELSARNDAFGDRRPQLYGGLLRAGAGLPGRR